MYAIVKNHGTECHQEGIVPACKIKKKKKSTRMLGKLQGEITICIFQFDKKIN